MSRASGTKAHNVIVGVILLLASYEGWHWGLCPNMSCLPTRQGGAQGTRGLAWALTSAERPWDTVKMDFITCFPNSKGFGTIMVVVDHYATFTVTTANCKAEEAAWRGQTLGCSKAHHYRPWSTVHWCFLEGVVQFVGVALLNKFSSKRRGSTHFWSCTWDTSLAPTKRTGQSCLTQLSSLTICNVVKPPGEVPWACNTAAAQHATVLACECRIDESEQFIWQRRWKNRLIWSGLI